MVHFKARPIHLFDVRAIAELLRARDVTFSGSSNLWDSSVYERLHGDGFDLGQSSRVLEAPDGTLAGFEAVFDTLNPLRAELWGAVNDDWRGQGVGSALLAWAIARRSAKIKDAAPDAQVPVTAMIYQQDHAAQQLLTDHGFQYRRSFYVMKRDFDDQIAAPPLPDGFRLVSYAAQPDLRLYVTLEAETFRDHWGWIDTPIDEDIAHWQHYMETSPDFDPHYWWVAYYGDEPAGLIMTQLGSNIRDDVAWINTLGVKREFRKRGLASALLAQAFAAHQRRGAAGIALAVDASSLTKAVALYERAGMTVYSQRDSYEKVLREGVDSGTD